MPHVVGAREKPAPHVGRGPTFGIIHLAPPANDVRMVGHAGAFMAGAVVEAAGVVADPGVLDVDPPVTLVLLDFDADFLLGAAGDAVGGEG